MPHVYVDADACPVKEEIYRVAGRYGLYVTLVANTWMRVPESASITLEVVSEGCDVADDWIVDHVTRGDIVVTADIPLAHRCLKRGARVLGPSGKVFTEEGIGSVLATRDLLTELRSAGASTGGPPPLTSRDRSRLLQELDRLVHAARKDQERAN